MRDCDVTLVVLSEKQDAMKHIVDNGDLVLSRGSSSETLLESLDVWLSTTNDLSALEWMNIMLDFALFYYHTNIFIANVDYLSHIHSS